MQESSGGINLKQPDLKLYLTENGFMRITMEDGTVVERKLSPEACTGYVAESIEMDAEDILHMAALSGSNPVGFQAMMRQLASRLSGGRANSEDLMERIRLESLCYACPEAYDAYIGDRQVGYLRLRHGTFSVDVPDQSGKRVLAVHPEGDGLFLWEERGRYLDMAKNAIVQELLTTGFDFGDEPGNEPTR